MRTLGVQKLDVSVGRGPKSWTCPYVFNGLWSATVNDALTRAPEARAKPVRGPAAVLGRVDGRRVAPHVYKPARLVYLGAAARNRSALGAAP